MNVDTAKCSYIHQLIMQLYPSVCAFSCSIGMLDQFILWWLPWLVSEYIHRLIGPSFGDPRRVKLCFVELLVGVSLREEFVRCSDAFPLRYQHNCITFCGDAGKRIAPELGVKLN